jgi:hypothetical protein
MANVSGGGVYAGGSAAVFITDSSVQGNAAVQSGNGVFLVDAAQVDATNSNVQGNTTS